VERAQQPAEAGLVDQAVTIADTLAGLDVANASQYAGGTATVLARAARPGEAMARVETNLACQPQSPWARIQAGEALVAMATLKLPASGCTRRSGSPGDGGRPVRARHRP
jgi:predicted Zn-dependent protease